MIRTRNILNQRFGLLVVIEDSVSKKGSTGKSKQYVKVQCDCGQECYKSKRDVLYGDTTSCGCLRPRKEVVWHGLGKHPLYKIYFRMISRCYDSKGDSRRWYFDKGITVCDRWLGTYGFVNFFNDMEPTYKIGLSLDRCDSTGNYEPNNCRWIPPAEQHKNKASNVWIVVYGERMIKKDFCRRFGLTWSIINRQFNIHKLTPEQIVLKYGKTDSENSLQRT